MVIKVKALVLENGEVFLKDVPTPTPQEEEVLIRVSLGGICSTDLEMVKGYVPFTGVMGHEFVGRVEIDPQGEFTGTRVVGEINIGCGSCSFCQAGLKNHCQKREVVGIRQRQGVFAEYVALPRENIYPVPVESPDEEAVFVEPLAAALQVLEQVHIPPSHRVVVLGDGRLGLLVAMVLAEAGLESIILGHHKEKMDIVKPLGVTGVVAEEFSEKVDLVVECTGSSAGFQKAQQILHPRGTIVLKTTVAGKASVDLASLVTGEITVVGSRCGPFLPALNLLKRGKLPLSKMVDKVFTLSQGKEALEYASRKGVKKVLLDMEC